ncbi:unnamed protein product [Parajaminaea phylloscopi]
MSDAPRNTPGSALYVARSHKDCYMLDRAVQTCYQGPAGAEVLLREMTIMHEGYRSDMKYNTSGCTPP